MDTVLAIIIGISLAACCGFRVFVPLLVLAIATRAGAVSLDPALAWVGSTPALICLGVATVLEILSFKIPGVDHVLDVIATPAAVVAGSLVAASQFQFTGENGAMFKWALAIIAGGGAAAAVQTTTVALRAASTAVSGGLANPVFATVESGAAVMMSVLAVVVPVLAFVMLLGFAVMAVYVLRGIWRRVRARREGRAGVRLATIPVRMGQPVMDVEVVR